MAPEFVAPYRKSDKNDANDAEAICEAVTRANMRFVPVKSTEQQALSVMGHISKRGDAYLRTLLVHGARSAMRLTPKQSDAKSRWVEQLRKRRGENIAVVALAAKHARIIWALMVQGE